MTFHQPGWVLPNGHRVRSRLEARLCEVLQAEGRAHAHGEATGLSFVVAIGPRRHALYVPSIRLDAPLADGRIVLVEPVGSTRPGGGVRRLVGMRQAHHTDYCLVVVARRSLAVQLPEEAYDVLIPAEALSTLGARLAEL